MCRGTRRRAGRANAPRHAGDLIHALQPMRAGGTDLILVAPPHLLGAPHRMPR